MFNSITGRVTHKLGSALFIETGGVEWDITVPSTDAASFPDAGSEARVFTWLLHREDQMKLFGFSSDERRSTFLELLKVEGIGAKGAIKIMGGITQDALLEALEQEDLARLEAVPGLGKKTAQKMLLALKGKIVRGGSKAAAAASSPFADIENALADMGFDRRNIANAVHTAMESIDSALSATEKEAQVFKAALAILTGSA